MGTYASTATNIDKFGTVLETTTVGSSVRLDENGLEIETGSYETKAENNIYGTLGTQLTTGESYNKIWDPTIGAAGDYTTYTVGTYASTATNIDEFRYGA